MRRRGPSVAEQQLRLLRDHPVSIVEPRPVLTDAAWAALKWMREHGGDCAVARVNGGGRIFLAQGETAPFLPSTARQLIDQGLAEYVDIGGRKSVRFRLTGGGDG